MNIRRFEEKIYSVSNFYNDHTFSWPRETTTVTRVRLHKYRNIQFQYTTVAPNE